MLCLLRPNETRLAKLSLPPTAPGLLNFDGPGEVVLGRIGRLAKTFDDRVFGLGGGGGLFVLEAAEALQDRLERSSIGDMWVVSDRDEMPLLCCGRADGCRGTW